MHAGDDLGLSGRVIDGRFRVDDFVGRGDLSIVYKGADVGGSRSVAIKCLALPPAVEGTLSGIFARAFREGLEVQRRLAEGSPHLARVVASGSTIAPRTGREVPFVVREWLQGHSLAHELASRRVEGTMGRPLSAVVKLLDPVVEALAYAHAKGAAHERINPKNLFAAITREDGAVLKVLDFGLARALHAAPRDEGALGRPRVLLSTALLAYVAPEQLDGSVGEVGPRSDVYSLALLVLEALHDRPVFEGTAAEIAPRVLDRARRPSAAALGIVLPPPIEELLARALAVDPKKRPRDARDFWNALKDASPEGTWDSVPKLLVHAKAPPQPSASASSSPSALPFAPAPSAPAPSVSVGSAPMSVRVPPPAAKGLSFAVPDPIPTPPPSPSTDIPVEVQAPQSLDEPLDLTPLYESMTPTPVAPLAQFPELDPEFSDMDAPVRKAVGPVRPPTPAIPFAPEPSIIVAAEPPPRPPVPKHPGAPPDVARRIRRNQPTLQLDRRQLTAPAPTGWGRYVLVVVGSAAVVFGVGVGARTLLASRAARPVSPAPQAIAAAAPQAPPQPSTAVTQPVAATEVGEVLAASARVALVSPEGGLEADGGMKAFDKDVARAALDAVDATLVDCKIPRGHSSKIKLTFAPDGTMTSAVAQAPYLGMPQGACIGGHLKEVRVPPFRGPPVGYLYTFTIPR